MKSILAPTPNDSAIPTPILTRAARINLATAAAILGFTAYDLRILVRVGAITPLGRGIPCGSSYFSRAFIEGLTSNFAWLDIASAIIPTARRHKESSPQVAALVVEAKTAITK